MSRKQIREQIIEACAPVFNRKGYQFVSIPDLEQASGKTKAVLYGYFENKTQMAMVVLEHNLEQKRALINREVQTRQSITDKLLTHIAIHRPEQECKLISGGCPILNAATEADDTNEQMRQLAAKALLLWKQDITELIRAGITNGELKNNIDAEETAWQLITMIEGAVLTSRTTQNARLCSKLLNAAENWVLGLKADRR